MRRKRVAGSSDPFLKFCNLPLSGTRFFFCGRIHAASSCLQISAVRGANVTRAGTSGAACSEGPPQRTFRSLRLSSYARRFLTCSSTTCRLELSITPSTRRACLLSGRYTTTARAPTSKTKPCVSRCAAPPHPPRTTRAHHLHGSAKTSCARRQVYDYDATSRNDLIGFAEVPLRGVLLSGRISTGD